MTSRLIALTAFLTAAHAVLLGLYWLLLSVPESNVAMLAASALIVIACFVLFGWIQGFGLLAWRDDAAVRALPRKAIGAIPAVWIGMLLFVVIWFVVSSADGWWSGHRGEIDAWFMAKYGWADTGRLHTAVLWIRRIVSEVIGLSLGLSLAASCAVGGLRAVAKPAWLRAAFGIRRLVSIAVILFVCYWLFARGAWWRPKGLAPNWQETAFVSAKLGVLYLLGNIGWALALGTTRRDG